MAKDPKGRKKKEQKDLGAGAATSRALAEILGIAPGTVTRLRRHAGWPVRTTPPWSAGEVAEIQAFRTMNQEDRAGSKPEAMPPPADSPPPPDDRKEPTTVELAKRLAIAKTEGEEHATRLKFLKMQKEAGLLVPRDQMDLSLEALARFFMQELKATETRLVSALPGDPGAIRSVIEQEHGRMLDRLGECKEIALQDAAEVDKEL